MARSLPHRRATRRRVPRPVPPPSVRPWPIVVLAIDPGLTSGWAIWARGRYVDSGEVSVLDPEAVARVVRAALRWRELVVPGEVVPVVLVLERPWSGRQGNASGPARPIWKATWAREGGVKSHFVKLYPATWRSRVLGKGMGSAPRERAREVEQRVARMVSGRRVGADEAPAVCIGKCACHAGEVGEVLPKRWKEAA